MEVRFVKLSPTQNVTVLVEDAVPREQQAALAAKLLEYDNVGGEQVGFLEPATLPGARLRLQMMGGEFCGNATMSAAAYLAWQEGLAEGAQRDYPLEVSGADKLMVCRIKRAGDAFLGTVHMPFPERFDSVVLDTDAGSRRFPVVVMPGISHVIVSSDAGLSREEIDRRIRAWNEIVRADALGVLLHDVTDHSIAPIVYVPATDSAVWERGCGSGTAALGCWLAHSSASSVVLPVRQPGGIITVTADASSVAITGTVRITARGLGYA